LDGLRAARHELARRYLSTCLHALEAFHVGDVSADSNLQLSHLMELVTPAYKACSNTDALDAATFSHQSDKPLLAAYRAAINLSVGSGDYQEYVLDLIWGRRDHLLRTAEREIAKGQADAAHALRQLARQSA
jgi:hypothetical protein